MFIFYYKEDTMIKRKDTSKKDKAFKNLYIDKTTFAASFNLIKKIFI